MISDSTNKASGGNSSRGLPKTDDQDLALFDVKAHMDFFLEYVIDGNIIKDFDLDLVTVMPNSRSRFWHNEWRFCSFSSSFTKLEQCFTILEAGFWSTASWLMTSSGKIMVITMYSFTNKVLYLLTKQYLLLVEVLVLVRQYSNLSLGSQLKAKSWRG